MSSADIGTYGEELYEQVLPLHGPDPHGLARDYIGAIVSQVLEIDDLARDDAQGRPGWGAILDVADCPIKGLPWLAQIAGVSLRNPKLITLSNAIVNPSIEFDYLPDFGADSHPVIGGTTGNRMIRHTVSSNATISFTFSLGFSEFRDLAVGVDVIHVSRDLHLDIEFTDGSFSTLATFASTPSDQPGRRELTAKAPAGTVFAYFHIWVPSSLTGETIDLDAFAMIPDSKDATFFDGTYPNARWSFPASPETSYSILERAETDEEWAVYARDAIRRQGGKGRGTVDAMLSAAEDTLIGTRTGRILERVGGNAYALELITRPSETLNPDATLAAALTQKPAGMSLTHTLTEGVIIDEGTSTIDTATATIDTATLGDVT